MNPSLIEGFGIVVLEGFASQKPVLVSDSKPLSDLVDDSVDGFIIKHDDVDAWAQKILTIFNDGSLGRKMGSLGRDKVSKKYSISKIVNDLEQLYKSIQK